MIIFSVSREFKAALVAGLTAHGTDRLVLAGLGRVSRENSAAAIAAVIAAWPAEPDGRYRIALSDVAGYIVWRSFVCSEIALGRGKRDDVATYRAALGIETKAAYDYVAAVVKGSRMRPCSGRTWSDNTRWVVFSSKIEEPRARWSRSAWVARARAHKVLADAGLALPRQPTWKPIATALFDEPKRVEAPPVLSAEDDAALAALA
ncbi:hypothetical protein IQ16_03717 [Bradyrhizobium huanghuaihaiense]|uniref:Uncharacterized protein n=1 Tax=Bradyrhizobium huanghuaihaiense TaxID=990078 RepID=A0A562RPR4_9BRAD|nr:hypothetical protein [Bradyrhizobium huanghuaihaiense]TWI70544.1 hypothetical protein IQ16_03717 [Bradyrhizobium huanghuaihaiense]